MEKCIISTCNTIQLKKLKKEVLVNIKENWELLIPIKYRRNTRGSSKICKLHFEDKFKDPKTGDLLENAIPTIFPRKSQHTWSDFTERCRFCLNKLTGDKMSINLEIENHFKQFTDIDLNNSYIYSREICQRCYQQLEFGLKLKRKFISKQKFLINSMKSFEDDQQDDKQPPEVEFIAKEEIGDSVEDFKIKEENVDVLEQPETAIIAPALESNIKLEDDLVNENISSYYEPSYDDADDFVNNDDEDEAPEPDRKSTKKTKKEKKPYDKNFVCKDCGLTLRKTSKTMHILRFHTKNLTKDFICDICGFAGIVKNELRKHMFKHSSERNRICTFCQKGFKTGKDLNWHIKKIHLQPEPKKPRKPRTPKKKKEIKEEDKDFFCKDCELTLRKSSQKYHMLRFHPKDTSRDYICDICGLRAVTKNRMRRHMFRHSSERTQICSYCQKSFKAVTDLNWHIKNMHIKVKLDTKPIKKEKKPYCKDFLCADCGLTIRKTSKPYHMLRFHNKTVKKNFVCDVCGFRAIIKKNLRSHMFKHSSERRHICSYCHKGYKTGKDLNWHVKKMHKEAKNPKRFSCTHCGLVMSTKVGLEDHIYTQHLKEERFECDVPGCGETFLRHELFKQHKAKHAGISFPCPHCGRVFYAIGQFNLHMKSHLKPEKCDRCEKFYATPSALRIHINSAHEKKRDYICTYCGKSYHIHGHLNRHLMEAHMKIRLECEIPSCKQHFARKDLYRNHVKSHHKDLGEKEMQALLLKIKNMKFEFDERQIVN